MRVGLFVPFLAGDAAHGDRIRQQAFDANLAAALDAAVDIPRREALARVVDLAQFVQMALDKSGIQISQHIRDRFVTEVVHLSREINISLIARSQQSGA